MTNHLPKGSEGIIEVRFHDGPLAHGVRRMVGIGDRLVAWEHLQAKGIVQVAWPDETERQANLWKRHDYRRSAHGDGWATYELVGEQS